MKVYAHVMSGDDEDAAMRAVGHVIEVERVGGQIHTSILDAPKESLMSNDN